MLSLPLLLKIRGLQAQICTTHRLAVVRMPVADKVEVMLAVLTMGLRPINLDVAIS